ncbi:MAG: glycosyltransferase [candidate division Zixibacteria bacterium]
MSKISVLHIVLTTDTGGMENVVYNLGVGVDPSRIHTQVGYLLWRGHLSDLLDKRNIKSEMIPRGFPVLSLIYPRQMIKYIKSSGCQIVHAHSGCWFKVAAACAHLPHIKLIYTDHGRTYPEKKLQIMMDRFSMRYTDKVVAVGSILQKYLIDGIGLPSEKVININNCIDTGRFSPCDTRIEIRKELDFSEDDLLIGIVARLAPVKNHRFLIKAFKQVSQKFPRARLLIIGSGPLKNDLEMQVDDLNLKEKIVFMGDRQDVPRLLNAMDFTTLSSLSEGVSLTILEAMASGLPVVATAVGGNSSIIKSGLNGILVESGNLTEYVIGLNRLLESKVVRVDMGNKARKYVVSEWSLSTMTTKYEDLYESLLRE